MRTGRSTGSGSSSWRQRARRAGAGKLLADLGADVIVVEPPGGTPAASYGPFADDVDGPRAQPLVVALQHVEARRGARSRPRDAARAVPRAGRRRRHRARGRAAGRLAALGLDHAELRAATERLIWVSVTPFGRERPARTSPPPISRCSPAAARCGAAGTTTTRCRPVRGGGNQAYHTGSTGRSWRC